jgi:hypothetical protein
MESQITNLETFISLMIASLIPIAVGSILFTFRKKIGTFYNKHSVYRKSTFKETNIMGIAVLGLGFIAFGIFMLVFALINIISNSS